MKIKYTSFGNGPKTMVVVPGLSVGYVTGDTQALAAAFSAFTEDYTVYVFDVRDDVPEGYTISQMSEDLAAKLQSLGLHELYLYGCSMGGMQCIYLAANYPELVKAAVIASSSVRANATSESVMAYWTDLAREGRCRELTADMGQHIYSEAVYAANQDAFVSMADGLTEELLTRFLRTAGAIRGLDLTKEAAAVQCPVLVLGSEGDRVLTADASREIAQLTGGELYLYGSEYPHAVYDEAPDFRDRVKAFFDRVS